MAGKKDPIYGPVKGFSYLAPDKQDAPSGLLRSNSSIRRDPTNNPQGYQAANLNRRSLYPPEDPDPLENSSHPGYPNTGYDESPVSSRRHSGLSGERHPMSPESHPTLFDNFILKGPATRSSQEPEPAPSPAPAPSRNSSEETRARPALQDLFQEPPPRSKPEDRSTKYSSQASSTMALLSDRNSGSSGRMLDPYPSSKISASTIPVPIEPAYSYDKNISLNADPKYNYNNSQAIQPPKKANNKNGEFFPQLGTAPLPAQASPTLRPVTHSDDLNTLMRQGSPESPFASSEASSRCTFIVILIVVILICLGVGFVAGWFAYKMANEEGEQMESLTTLLPPTSSILTTTGGTDAETTLISGSTSSSS